MRWPVRLSSSQLVLERVDNHWLNRAARVARPTLYSLDTTGVTRTITTSRGSTATL
jgi:hypothetical protein